MSETKTHFIPAGRTGLVAKGEFKLQVQTEYAPRPIPRISTTILCSGELLHRVDVPLDDPIESQQDVITAERLIVLQHGEVLRIVSENSFGLDSEFPYEDLWLMLYSEDRLEATGKIDLGALANSALSGKPGVSPLQNAEGETGRVGDDDKSTSAAREFGSDGSEETESTSLASIENVSQDNIQRDAAPFGVGAHAPLNIRDYREPRLSDSDKVRKINRTTLERLYSMDGVDKVLPVEWRGKFLTDSAEKEFKRKFKAVYKKLDQALEVFPPLSGGRGREEGIYELERRRLYMVSHGAFVYFVILRQASFTQPIEDVIREALDS